MEMIFIASVALIAFAAVLIPLLKRRPNGRDDDEFSGRGADAESRPTTRPEEGEGIVPPMAAGPATPVAATDAAPDAEGGSEEDVELEVQRYRAALRAGTICNKCGQANPAESRFCFDCGAQLPLGEAREFD